MAKSEFHFHGPTVFIDKPRETVVQDFQNKHSAGPTAEVTDQLAELLRLVLSSQVLSDRDREDTARLVEETAERAEADEPAEAASRLSRIGTAVDRAADIAKPASTIVAALARLFT